MSLELCHDSWACLENLSLLLHELMQCQQAVVSGQGLDTCPIQLYAL